MHQKSFIRFLTKTSIAASVIGMLALSACGASSATVNKAIKIGTDLPVSGTDAGVAKPTENGAVLAFEQNANLGNGYTLTSVLKNDEGASGADPQVGASNIRALIADAQVVAMVGPFNSGVAKAEIPIANNATFPMISPTNTNPGLTKQEFAVANKIDFNLLHPAGKPSSYFRVPATDEVQGKANADIALGAPINAKVAFVVDDTSTYGVGLAAQFTKEFTAKGGKVVDTAEITATQSATFGSLATKILSDKPDVVFYGGVTSQGGAQLKKAVADAGAPQLPFGGGDGIADDPEWLKTATTAGALNTFGTVPAPDLSGFTSGAQTKFISDYKTRFGSDPLPYSAQAYDCAMIEIKAIKNVIAAGKDVTRANVRDAIQSISYTGLTGTITFDANGDNSGQKVFSVYKVDATGAWVFVTNYQG